MLLANPHCPVSTLPYKCRDKAANGTENGGSVKERANVDHEDDSNDNNSDGDDGDDDVNDDGADDDDADDDDDGDDADDNSDGGGGDRNSNHDDDPDGNGFDGGDGSDGDGSDGDDVDDISLIEISSIRSTVCLSRRCWYQGNGDYRRYCRLAECTSRLYISIYFSFFFQRRVFDVSSRSIRANPA